MAIDRTNYNALVDDDGSGTLGSVWNKQQIKDVLLDPMDAALLTKASTVLTSTTTGVQNAWNPGLVGQTVIQWTGGADLTVNGLLGGSAGQAVTLRNTGTAAIYIAHASGAAAAGTQFANVATSGPTPLAVTGFATWVWVGGYWLLVAHEQGQWITPAHVQGDYTASAGSTWTVSAIPPTCRYRLTGRTYHLALDGAVGAVSGSAATALYRVIPGGYSTGAIMRGVGLAAQNGSYVTAHIATLGGGDPRIAAAVHSGASLNAPWNSGTTAGLYFTLTCEVN